MKQYRVAWRDAQQIDSDMGILPETVEPPGLMLTCGTLVRETKEWCCLAMTECPDGCVRDMLWIPRAAVVDMIELMAV